MTVSDHRNSPAPEAGAAGVIPSCGLRFEVVEKPVDFLNACHLVYEAYSRAGLIEPNPHEIYLHRHLLECESMVAVGKIDSLVVSTLSGYLDGPAGLPLDSVYPDQLKAFRDAGKQLIEVGMFADRRERLYRSINAVLELMRLNTWFGVKNGFRDAVIGVHPHHMNFYTRLLGFEQVGEVKDYPRMKDNPVVLLYLDFAAKSQLPNPPRGLKMFLDNPMGLKDFARRYDPTWEDLEATPAGAFLQTQAQAAA